MSKDTVSRRFACYINAVFSIGLNNDDQFFISIINNTASGSCYCRQQVSFRDHYAGKRQSCRISSVSRSKADLVLVCLIIRKHIVLVYT